MFKFRHFNHFLFYNPKNVPIPPTYGALIDYTWSTQATNSSIEFVINGTFDTDTIWTKNVGWKIANGKATYDGTGGTSFIQQSIAFINGNTYTISLDVISNEGTGANTIDTGAAEDRINTSHLDVGHHEFTHTAVDATKFTLYGRANEVFEVDNISIIQLGSYSIETIDSKNNYNASEYSGEAITFDSTTYLDLTGLITGAVSMIYILDGIVTYTETPFYLLNNGTYKDVYYFSRVLTQSEKDRYSNHPNEFFQDIQDSVITDCVGNIPMSGTDEIVKNYANNIDTADADLTSTYFSELPYPNVLTRSENKAFFHLENSTGADWKPQTILGNSNRVASDTYLFEAILTVTAGIAKPSSIYSYISANKPSDLVGTHGVGTYRWSWIDNFTDSNQFVINFDGLNYHNTDFSIEMHATKIGAGIFQITGYDSAKRQHNLNYGTQELNFLKDGLWRGKLSPYLETDTGHADTGYTPSGTFQIEEVTEKDGVETHKVYQNDGNKYTNGSSDGTLSVPAIEVILNNQDIESNPIDKYKVFRLYSEINNASSLYSSYLNSKLTISGIINDLKSKLLAKEAVFNIEEEDTPPTYGAEYYVSTTGSDSNIGDINNPFLTFEKARDTIRTNGVPANGVCVWVRGGTYYRTTTFILDTNDKGTVANPIHYRRYPNEKVIISGGQAIDPANFHLANSGDELYNSLDVTAKSNIYVCDLHALGITDYGNTDTAISGGSTTNNIMELSVNGQIQTLARYPKAGVNTETIPTIDDDVITIYSDDADSANIAGTYTRVPNTSGREYKWVNSVSNYLITYTELLGWQIVKPDNTGVTAGGPTPKSLPKQFNNLSKPNAQTITNDAIIQGFAQSGSRPSSTSFTYFGNRPERWQNLDDVRISSMFRYYWYASVTKVTGIDTATKTITVNKPFNYHTDSGDDPNRNAYYYAWNIIEELTQDGEYYMDRINRKLYVYDNPAGKSLTVSMTMNTLIEMDGCENVEFYGIKLRDSRGLLVDIHSGKNNRLYKCELSNSSAMLADISYAPTSEQTNCGFEYCHLHDAGLTDIKISGGDRKLLINGGNYLTNSNIHDGGRLYWPYKGIIIQGCGNVVSHNNIYNTPHMAIGYFGNEHIIEYNNIHHALLFSSDMGAIYAGRRWDYRGNKIRYNFIHDLVNYTGVSEIHGVYMDDGLAGNKVIGNIGDNLQGDFFFSHGGRDYTFEYNIANNIYEVFRESYTGHIPTGYYPDVASNSSYDFLAAMKGNNPYGTNPELVDYTSAEWKAKYPELYNLIPDKDNTDRQTQWDSIYQTSYQYPAENSVCLNNALANINVYHKLNHTDNGVRFKHLDLKGVDVNSPSFILTDTNLIGPNV